MRFQNSVSRLLAIILAAAVMLVAPTKPHAADPYLLGMLTLLDDDPEFALEELEGHIEDLAARPGDNRRELFDLWLMRAELLELTGREGEAASAFAELAAFAARFRDLGLTSPEILWFDAVRLYRAIDEPRSAIAALEQLLAEQRDGARPPGTIAETLRQLAELADLAGDAGLAASYREQAEAVLSAQAPSTRGSEGGYREVEIFYATDRARTGEKDPNTFYGYERGQLELGRLTVTVPDQHVPGVVEAPSIWKLEFRADPARHVVLRSVEPLDSDGFYSRLNARVAETPGGEAFVFIHGYNVTFDGAARRAAQIAYDMNYPGVPILYSWPSRGRTTGYIADSAVVRLSGRRLSTFLEDLAARSGASTIHVVAHSMGNGALTDALELIAARRNAKPGDEPVFGQVLFAAPDIDAGLFKATLPAIRPLAKRLTLYASEEDWALTASRKLHGDAPRAGIGGTGTLSDPAIDSVDMSELGEDMLAHSYFADDTSALVDMSLLFWRNIEPQRRCGLVREEERTDTIWRYERGRCADRNLIDVIGHLRRANVSSVGDALKVLNGAVADRTLSQRLAPVVEQIISQ